MKKAKLMLFFMPLVISIFFLIPIKISAQTPDGYAEDWYNYITQFEDGIATASIDTIHVSFSPTEAWFTILIIESPDNEFNGYYIQYICLPGVSNEHYDYFEEVLADAISYWSLVSWDPEDIPSFDIAFNEYKQINELDIEYNGIIYWNFEERYWQVEYYNTSIDDNDNKEVGFMVTDLLDTLAEIGAGIGDLFGKIVESVGQFFYTPGTGDTPGSFTIIGILTIAAVVVSLSMWVLRLILRLFKLRG